MGFAININYILRQEPTEKLEVGKEYPFQKDELCFLVDEITIWLTKKDWTPLADIKITTQSRKDGKTTGTYVVKYLYSKHEQQILKEIFKRNYGWK